jgi:hypothetical protein
MARKRRRLRNNEALTSLKLDPPEIVWLNKNTYGEYDEALDTISINIWTTITTVYLHELFHRMFPRASEKEVRELEVQALNYLSMYEIREIAEAIMRLPR